MGLVRIVSLEAWPPTFELTPEGENFLRAADLLDAQAAEYKAAAMRFSMGEFARLEAGTNVNVSKAAESATILENTREVFLHLRAALDSIMARTRIGLRDAHAGGHDGYAELFGWIVNRAEAALRHGKKRCDFVACKAAGKSPCAADGCLHPDKDKNPGRKMAGSWIDNTLGSHFPPPPTIHRIDPKSRGFWTALGDLYDSGFDGRLHSGVCLDCRSRNDAAAILDSPEGFPALAIVVDRTKPGPGRE